MAAQGIAERLLTWWKFSLLPQMTHSAIGISQAARLANSRYLWVARMLGLSVLRERSSACSGFQHFVLGADQIVLAQSSASASRCYHGITLYTHFPTASTLKDHHCLLSPLTSR